MPSSPLSFASFQNVSLQRLLRKDSLDKVVLVLKAALILLMVLGIYFLVQEFIENYLNTATEVQKIENDVQTKLVKNQSETPATAKKRDYNVIATKNLLGPLTVATVAAPVKPTAKPAANMQLTLVGTFVTGQQDPYAIIEDTKKSIQDVFNVNDLIFGDAKLISIKSDRVEISRNGQTEVLVLDDLTTGSKVDYKDGIAQVDNNQYYVQEAEIDKALENLPMLLTQARAVPFFKDGKSVGLRLFAIKNDSIFEKIGLKNADILKSVNGNSLGDLTQAIKLFETLKQERSISIVLERNSEEKEFKYDIR